MGVSRNHFGYRGTVLGTSAPTSAGEYREISEDVWIWQGDNVEVLIEATHQVEHTNVAFIDQVETVVGGLLWRVNRFRDFLIGVNPAPRSLRIVANAVFFKSSFLVAQQRLVRATPTEKNVLHSMECLDCSNLQELTLIGNQPEWLPESTRMHLTSLVRLTVRSSKVHGCSAQNIPTLVGDPDKHQYRDF
jgi:hypothetical protein